MNDVLQSLGDSAVEAGIGMALSVATKRLRPLKEPAPAQVINLHLHFHNVDAETMTKVVNLEWVRSLVDEHSEAA